MIDVYREENGVVQDMFVDRMQFKMCTFQTCCSSPVVDHTH